MNESHPSPLTDNFRSSIDQLIARYGAKNLVPLSEQRGGFTIVGFRCWSSSFSRLHVLIHMTNDAEVATERLLRACGNYLTDAIDQGR
jgi:hypothetical protein